MSAGPIQTWRIVNGLPELPATSVLVAPGPGAFPPAQPQASEEAVVEAEAPAPSTHAETIPEGVDTSQVPAPAIDTAEVDLSDCGDLAEYDEVVYGTLGDDRLDPGADAGDTCVAPEVDDEVVECGEAESPERPDGSLSEASDPETGGEESHVPDNQGGADQVAASQPSVASSRSRVRTSRSTEAPTGVTGC